MQGGDEGGCGSGAGVLHGDGCWPPFTSHWILLGPAAPPLAFVKQEAESLGRFLSFAIGWERTIVPAPWEERSTQPSLGASGGGGGRATPSHYKDAPAANGVLLGGKALPPFYQLSKIPNAGWRSSAYYPLQYQGDGGEIQFLYPAK